MTTALAAQLAQIAAKSKSSLDVKAQKAAHSKSLIFEPRVAASQNFQTLYSICREGFEDLCSIDPRFAYFGKTIFSEQSQNEDRTQMTTAENAELDKKIESFLRLVGARLRLMPAIKAIEWLIRRFRIHEYNTAILISTFLPYHTIPAFRTLMSILSADNLPPLYKFLDPYVRSLTQLPRAVLVHRAIHHPDLLTAISVYTLDCCKSQQHYPALISFWGGIATESVSGMIDRMRSGRRNIQSSNDQTLLHRIGPILSDALVMDKAPDLQIACYMVLAVFVAKGDLEDGAISALMEQLVAGWTTESLRPGLVCLSMLAHYRSAKQLSGRVTRALLKVQGLPDLLLGIGKEHNIGKLANGLCLALVDRISRKGDAKGLPVIESILSQQVLNEAQTAVLFKFLLLAAHKIDDEVDPQGAVRKALASTIIGLTRADTASRDVFTKVISDTDVDVDALELRLDAEIRPKAITGQPSDDVVMKDEGDASPDSEDFPAALQRAGALQTEPTDSCLQSFHSDIFMELCAVFISSVPRPEDVASFNQIAPLQRTQASKSPFYFTFLMRVWSGPYPTLARVGALDMAKDRLKQEDCAGIDFQAILPYCIVALNDASRKVRRAAADLLAVLENFHEQLKSKSDEYVRWGHDRIYDNMKSVEWMSPEVSRKFMRLVIVPSLEECVLNADHVLVVVQNALNSSSRAPHDGAEKDKKHHLSHGTRLSILTFLASHIVNTPLLTVKLRLLTPLNQIKSISGTCPTQLLLPLLSWWSSLSPDEVRRLCAAEKIDESAVDQSTAEVLLANEKSGLEFVLGSIEACRLEARPGLLHALFLRIQKIWSSMKTETKHVVAQRMLDLTQKGWSEDCSPASSEAADLLKSVELNTDILLFFLESLEPTAKMATEPSPNKRRRTSSSDTHRGVSTQATPELASALKQVTFVLQLVEGSSPEDHPQLLNALFNTLSELQHFRALVGSELGYLQNLVLRSLLAMVPAYKNNKELKIDRSGGHGDLLVNCIQKSSSPAVQSSALLLVASLANVAPELILHSVMPIFTFMGNSVLRQSDDYSAHVINQTVKEVVPPLIKALLKGKKDPLTGASELLLSFVTAYEHIPSHRRLGLFISLVETLDADKFLFAVLAMLADKYGSSDQVLSFSAELFNYFKVETQLQSLVSLLSLIADVFKPKPALSSVLLGTNEEGERDPQKIAFRQLNLLPYILSNRKLRTQVSKLAERDDMEASKVRELYSTLLKDLLGLADSLKSYKNLYSRCGDTLSKLLNLLSIAEFIKAVETLLDRQDPVLRRKVLRSVEVRIDQESQGDANSRAALLAFLPQLTAIIRASDDTLYKHVAVDCVDKIAEKYGKKDPEAVIAAASTIAGDQCLGQDDDRLRVMALLCLASLVDVLQDGVVPVLPSAIPKAIAYITESLQETNPHAELHNAGYAFMTALAQHLPYMLSGSYLQQLLAVSSVSAKRNLGAEANNARLQCLNFLAKQIDAKAMFSALEQNWSTASNSGFAAMREYLDTLGLAIDKHKKNVIEKNIASLSAIFLNAFDLRRSEHIKGDTGSESMKNINRIEELVNGVALKMIYKLNDAAFRPIFIRLMEWTATGLPKKDAAGKILRQISVFSFLLSFFDALRSIVTSYASYMTDLAVSILNNTTTATNPKGFSSTEERELWRKVLRTLAKCFEHDQDDFWQAPAHFDAVAPALTAQFTLLAAASSPSSSNSSSSTMAELVAQDLVPAVLELANAADSGEHQKALNGALLKHMRSEHAAVRLAAVRCEQALTDRLGEEWLAMLPEMLPYISELQEDDDEHVERETHRWIVGIEGVLGESLDAMLQ
ncbi:hypothetical protein DL763_003053 [Monosporascus cannonballus]|nr:hypothetical protein DL763_003053 [Monosporascus cannonballus]